MRRTIEKGPFLFPEMEEGIEEDEKLTETRIPEQPQRSSLPKLEVTHCQYCQDAGLCSYCKRGKQETAKLRKRR